MKKNLVYFKYQIVNRIFFVLIILNLFAPYLNAKNQISGLPPHKKLSELSIIHWNTDNGLPINNINDIFQSKNGFIWLATYEGFLKFDGIKTIEIRDLKNPSVRPPVGYSVTEGSDNNIWLSSLGLGALKYDGKEYHSIQGSPKSVISIFEDNQKQIWIGSINSGLFQVVEDSVHKLIYPGINDATINSITQDSKNKMWFATDGKGLTSYHKNEFHTYNTESGLCSNIILSILPDQDDALWVGTVEGLNRFSKGKMESFPRMKGVAIRKMAVDSYGNLWMATNQGIFRRNVDSKKFEQLWVDQGLPSGALSSIIFDREGSLWVSSERDGLFQLIPSSFYNLKSANKEYDLNKINIINEVENGVFLLGAENGKIYKYEQGLVSAFNVKINLHNQRIRDLIKDKEGNIWVCTYEGLLKKNDNTEKLLTIKDGLPSNQTRVIYQDKKGDLWLGTRNGGIVKFQNEKIVKTYNKASGMSSDFIMSIDEDKQGNILVGTVGGGLNIIKTTGEILTYNEDDGLPGEVIFNTTVDSSGAVWVCSNNGLTKFFNGIFVTIFKSDGLLVDSPFDFIQDDLGSVWIPSTYGVIKISRKELDDFVDLKINKVNAELFDHNNGMISKECIGATRSLKSNDGRIWFPTVRGITSINPSKIPKNLIAPPVIVISAKADSETVDVSKKIELHAATQRYLFEFTALSFTAPQKVKFKYRLEGFDLDWVEPEHKERYAAYTNLPFGNYTFKVIASNNNGIWNEEGASVDLYIQPYFYQRPLFYVSSILVAFLLVWGSVRWRTKMIKQKSRELEKIVKERTLEIELQQEEITRQRDNLKESYDSIKKLSEVGEEITSCLSVEAILETSYANINQIMTANIFAIGIYNEENKAIHFFGKEKDVEPVLTGSDLMENNSLLSVWCLSNQKEVFINDFIGEYKQYHPVNYHHKQDINSMIYLPLNTKSKKLGVISVQAYEKNSYTSYDLNILRNLTVSVSIALENAEVYQNMQLQKEEIEAQSEKLKTANNEIVRRNSEIENAHHLIQNKNDELSQLNSMLEAKIFQSTYELRTALKELDMFIYRTAHDLKGPVARLLGLCNIISVEDDKTLINQCVDMMRENSLEMKTLLNVLMRTQNVKNKELEVEEINLHNTIQNIFESFSENPNFSKIQFNIQSSEPVKFYSDPFLITNLFRNVLENSINFIDENNDSHYIKIEIGLEGNNKYKINIKDNGIGISKDVSGKIYDMFFRGTEHSKGFGIGLYEVKLIIERLNGKIWFKRSNSEETEFLIFLPFKEN